MGVIFLIEHEELRRHVGLHMTIVEVTALLAAACAAGFVNSLAGGGTLITFPVLLAFGVPPLVANATNTLAIVAGTFGGVYGYREPIRAVTPWLKRFIPVSLIGGLIGGVLLTCTEETIFAKLVPFLLLFATVLFMAQGAFKKAFGHPAKRLDEAGGRLWWVLVFQFFVAVYGGYFGAGIGILMLASLGVIGLSDIHQMNGLKTVLGSLINLIAALWFIWSGLIDWPRVAVMTMGTFAGYYIGSHFAQRIPQVRVRQIIVGVGAVITGVQFYKQFAGP